MNRKKKVGFVRFGIGLLLGSDNFQVFTIYEVLKN